MKESENSRYNWRFRAADPALAEHLASSLRLHPLLARVLVARGFVTAEAAGRHLEPRLANLQPPDRMAGLAAAVARIGEAVCSREHVGIFGDYDVDGITSATLLADYLRCCNVEVTVRVARRQEGYGFGPAQAQEMAASGCSVLVLVDCGTNDHEAVECAMQAGLEVLAVDHHKVTRPGWPGLALVNPQQPECAYPYKGLSAVGLVFFLVARLRRYLEGRGRETPDPRDGLDLVALGTIADVAPLDGENRILVASGLERLSRTERPGLRELLRLCQIAGRVPTSEDVGWRLGPRLNAPGRIDDAAVSLGCLWERDALEAALRARRCHELNEQRKEMQARVLTEALEQAAAQADEGCAFLLAAGHGWHQGVIGIVAAKLVEVHRRPAAVVGLEGDVGRGSARGVPGVDLVGLLSECSSLLLRFGGHAGAAGFAVAVDRLAPLRQRLHELSGPHLEHGAPRVLEIDGPLALQDVDLDLCRHLGRLAPYGQSCPAPVLAVTAARVERARVVGSDHLLLQLRQGPEVRSAIGFGMAQRLPAQGAEIDAAVALEIDDYQGPRARLRLLDLSDAAAGPGRLAAVVE